MYMFFMFTQYILECITYMYILEYILHIPEILCTPEKSWNFYSFCQMEQKEWKYQDFPDYLYS